MQQILLPVKLVSNFVFYFFFFFAKPSKDVFIILLIIENEQSLSQATKRLVTGFSTVLYKCLNNYFSLRSKVYLAQDGPEHITALSINLSSERPCEAS